VKEHVEEYFSHKKHRNTPSKFHMKSTEVVIQESKGLTHCKAKFTFQYYSDSSKKIDVIKTYR
jgi:hypothetical protein